MMTVQVEKLFDIACALTDVMACVPYEQRSFEIGPRDYLNQLTSLVTTLRGGAERYLPLLITKINDTLYNACPVGYTLCQPLGNTRVQHVHSETQQLGSAPTSSESTPFSTPPIGPISVAQTYGFPEMHLGQPATSADMGTISSSGDKYSDYTTSASVHMIQPRSLDGFSGDLTPGEYTSGSG